MKYPDFTIYWKEQPSVRVCFDENGKPAFTALSDAPRPVLLYGMDGRETPDAERLERFFRDRCFPPTRQNAGELLKILGLPLYQPKLICRKTHGIVAHDRFWLRYEDDPADIRYAQLIQDMSQGYTIA